MQPDPIAAHLETIPENYDELGRWCYRAAELVDDPGAGPADRQRLAAAARQHLGRFPFVFSLIGFRFDQTDLMQLSERLREVADALGEVEEESPAETLIGYGVDCGLLGTPAEAGGRHDGSVRPRGIVHADQQADGSTRLVVRPNDEAGASVPPETTATATATTATAEGANKSEGGTTPPADPYADLRQYARESLIGQMRAVVEAVCNAGGELPIVELAIADGVGWEDPYQGFKDVQRRLRTKLKKEGWRLERRNNAARLLVTKA